MTLIEILVVLVLIGIVHGHRRRQLHRPGEKAKADAAKIEIEQIGQTLDLFKLEVGRYPTTQEGLQALITRAGGRANWNGPYWKKARCRRIRGATNTSTRRRGSTRRTTSSRCGADGKEGGDGANKDITSCAVMTRRPRRSRRFGRRSRAARRDAARAAHRAGDHGVRRRARAADVRRRRVDERAEDRRAPARRGAARSRAARRWRRARETLLAPRPRAPRRSRSTRDPRVHALPRADRDEAVHRAARSRRREDRRDPLLPRRRHRNGGRITLAAGERKFDVDVDWLTGRVAILE